MEQTQILLGTGEELARHLAQFPNKHFGVFDLPLLETKKENFSKEALLPELPPVAEGESLADFLGEFIGCVEGNGENHSDNTGEKFAAHLVKKHNEGHL